MARLSFHPSRSARRLVATALLMLLAAVSAAAAAPSTDSSCSASSSWGTMRASLAAQVVTLANDYRAAMGLSRLSVSSTLSASSEWKSLHMAGLDYFDHDDKAPVSRSAYRRALDCGYGGGSWGENIAMGYPSAASVFEGWLASPGHRENIENKRFTSTGVGVAADAEGKLYWTQSFGDDVPPVTGPSPLPATAPAGPLRLASGAAVLTVQKSRARIVAAVSFVNRTTGRPVTNGSVQCRADVGGKRLRVLSSVIRAQSAQCTWSVPVWAEGVTVAGSVAVQTGAAAGQRHFVHTLQ